MTSCAYAILLCYTWLSIRASHEELVIHGDRTRIVPEQSLEGLEGFEGLTARSVVFFMGLLMAAMAMSANTVMFPSRVLLHARTKYEYGQGWGCERVEVVSHVTQRVNE